jgi:hypothetical protein
VHCSGSGWHLGRSSRQARRQGIRFAWTFPDSFVALLPHCGVFSTESLVLAQALNAATAKIVQQDGRGVGIRARIEHIMKPGFNAALDALVGAISVGREDVDLVIDLGAPNFEPYDDFAYGLVAALSAINVGEFRNYILMGCAYPEAVPLPKPGGSLPRHDWLFYKAFVAKLEGSDRIPNFSDYTIVNPEFTPRDMRKIKSGGKLVYTLTDVWSIRKGGAFRDNPAQMHVHCDYVIKSGIFRGPTFSRGDDYIASCAVRAAKPSNQPWWKFVAINHHIMQVLDDLSTLGATA